MFLNGTGSKRPMASHPLFGRRSPVPLVSEDYLNFSDQRPLVSFVKQGPFLCKRER